MRGTPQRVIIVATVVVPLQLWWCSWNISVLSGTVGVASAWPTTPPVMRTRSAGVGAQHPPPPLRVWLARVSPSDCGEDGCTGNTVPHPDHKNNPNVLVSRRQAATYAATAACGLVAVGAEADPVGAQAEPLLCSEAQPSLIAVPIQASWTAVDGLNTVDDSLVAFDSSAYAAMRDDPTRTPLFRTAIRNRITDDTTTVLDLGTGPYALLAILAAEAGAARVYAVEANAVAAALARVTVQTSGWADVITVLEGLSTDLVLPEKVDLVLAEIVGSVCTEEGVMATIRDAHLRHVKNPDEETSWIPHRIQTLAAPASYTLHNLLQPPEFDWCKLAGEPVRFNCRDEGLQLLSSPQLLEDISFATIHSPSNYNGPSQQLHFLVDADRISDNQEPLWQEFKRGGNANANDLALATSRSFSGIAMWPRLFLQTDHSSPDGNRSSSSSITVDSRHYPNGEHQRSHWQTVLPIMTGRPVPNLVGGERVVVQFRRRECLPPPPTSMRTFPPPPKYSLDGYVYYNDNTRS